MVDPRAELEVLRGMLRYELPRNAGVRCGLAPAAVEAMCRRWVAAGWYDPEPGGAIDRGFLTAKGRVAVGGLLINGA